MITYHIMTEHEKKIIADWHYTGDYEVYNMPTYREQAESKVGFGNPTQKDNYYSYYDNDKLIGFTNILNEPQEVFIGIGIDPELCGHGYGQKILHLAQDISKSLYPGKRMYLEVRTWNERAIRCYQKAGFVIDGKAFLQKTMLGTGSFFRMTAESR